jgi:hypothetical protein
MIGGAIFLMKAMLHISGTMKVRGSWENGIRLTQVISSLYLPQTVLSFTK